ncbi:MAG: TolC family protein [Myxococcota bacterium]
MRLPQILGCLAVLGLGAPASAAPMGKVAIIIDGPSDLANRSVASLATEVETLLSDRTRELSFPRTATHVGDHTLARAGALLDEVLSDRTIDMVVGVGYFIGIAVGERQNLSKPVFLPFAEPEVQGLPKNGQVSGRKNLHYLGGLLNLEVELRRFRDVIDKKQSVYLVDELIANSRPKAIQEILDQEGSEAMKVELVPAGDSAAKILAAIPETTEAVFIGSLLRLPFSEVPILIEGLNQRGLPSYASQGRSWVEQGAFVSLVPEDEVQRRLRRVALYMDDVADGARPSQLSIVFEPRTELVINMRTARRIRVWPSFQLLTEAVLLDDDPEDRGEQLSIQLAVELALAENRDLAAVRKESAIAGADYKQSWSRFLPTASASGDATWIDPDTAAPFLQAERSINGALTVNQLLFEPTAVAAIGSADANRRAAVEVVRTSVLDTVQSAATAYLSVLRARTTEKINRDNLQRVRANLSLAEIRVDIGSSGREDVFRWQSELADSRVEVISASAQRNQAEIDLNRVLNRSLESAFTTVEPTQPESGFMITDAVEAFIDNPFSFRVFRDFMSEEAQRNSPEVQELEERIESLRATLRGLKQRLFLPEAFLTGLFTHVLARDGEASEPFDGGDGLPRQVDTVWEVALNLQWTFFDYTRFPEIKSTAESLEQLEKELAAATQSIEAGVRQALHQAGASRASVGLRRDAAQAAEANFSLVTDKYRQGEVDIITLLDAQNQALTANLAAANAVYDFLVDFVSVERAAGGFVFLESDDGKAAFEARLQSFATEYQE